MKSLSLAFGRMTRHRPMTKFVNEFGYHPIRLQERKSKDQIQCHICNRRCLVSTYDFGVCNAVFNAGDQLISTTYGVLAQKLDTVENIERVGFLHYKPGMTIVCPVNMHCNFGCIFCYQGQWSHAGPVFYMPDYYTSPQDIIEIATKQGVEGIAFSMTEPTVFFDFVVDTAILAKEAGFDVVMNSNGYMTPEAIDLLAPLLDAMSISVKGSGYERIYQNWLLTGPADPALVLQSIRLFYDRGVHVEVTDIFTRADCETETNIRNLSSWLADNVDRQLPFVLMPLRPWLPYQPLELFRISNKEYKKIVRACRQSGLQHIYSIPFDAAFGKPPNLVTHCPQCGTALVKRKAKREGELEDPFIALVYTADLSGLKLVNGEGYCRRCDTRIYGSWEPGLVSDGVKLIAQ